MYGINAISSPRRATTATGSRALRYSDHGSAGISARPLASVRPAQTLLPLRPRTEISTSAAGVPVDKFDTNTTDELSIFTLRIIPKSVSSIKRLSLYSAAFSDVPVWIINMPVLSPYVLSR